MTAVRRRASVVLDMPEPLTQDRRASDCRKLMSLAWAILRRQPATREKWEGAVADVMRLNPHTRDNGKSFEERARRALTFGVARGFVCNTGAGYVFSARGRL